MTKVSDHIFRFDPAEEMNWYLPQAAGKANKKYQLDYLLLWLTNQTLSTNYPYTEEYLAFVECMTGVAPQLVPENIKYPNFWYFAEFSKLQFLAMSSKINLANFIHKNSWYHHPVIVTDEISRIKKFFEQHQRIYVKSDFGFSGRGNFLITNWSDLVSSRLQQIMSSSKKPLMVEKFLTRVCDFSIALGVGAESKNYCYKNFVSEKGQYLGTEIDWENVLDVELFLKQQEVDESETQRFVASFSNLLSWYQSQIGLEVKLQGAFDFFIYRNDTGKLLIHPACEFNPRWSMGRVCLSLLQQPWFQRLRQQKKNAMKFLAPLDEKIADYRMCLTPHEISPKLCLF